MKLREYLDAEQSVITRTIAFPCRGETLVGVVHQPLNYASIGVVVVVGGPQYRVGSHRQFVTLAKAFAHESISVFRFDHRGIGNSTGTPREFYELHEDIREAIDCFIDQCPIINNIVLWGLCDGASAAALYACQDRRVSGLILLNPWLNTEQAKARSLLSSYYRSRLQNIDTWKRLMSGQLNFWRTATDVLLAVYRASGAGKLIRDTSKEASSLTRLMARELTSYQGNTLLILSEVDVTAGEFLEQYTRSPYWTPVREKPTVILSTIKGADHTFSMLQWQSEMVQTSIGWVHQLDGINPAKKGETVESTH